jgi:hypothetical protein
VKDKGVSMIPAPRSRRQIGDAGNFILWRDGGEPGRREGLACVVTACPDPECPCQVVHVDGIVIDERVTKVSWRNLSIKLSAPPGTDPAGLRGGQRMLAEVDPDSGEIAPHPGFPADAHPALFAWLAAELDEDLLEALHRYRARVKGYRPERPRTKIDRAMVERSHLASFDDLYGGTRFDDYLLDGHRYETWLHLCPRPDCDCHRLRLDFCPARTSPTSDDTVGEVLLHLTGDDGFEVLSIEPSGEAPGQIVRKLWALFQRRHPVGAYLRRRETQAKAVGATLWRTAPARVVPQPRRNGPCPCGSGRKYKQCHGSN